MFCRLWAVLFWILGVPLILDGVGPSLICSSHPTENEHPNINKPNKELIVPHGEPLQKTAYSEMSSIIGRGISASRIDEFEVTNLILASDIEGNLNAINRKTGELLWSLVGGQPLVQIESDIDKNFRYTHTTPVSSPSKGARQEPEDTYNRYNNPKMNSENTASQKKGNTYYNDANRINNSRNSRQKYGNEITWIVEPYGEGTVFQFTGRNGLEKLPLSIKQFVMNSPFSLDGFVYTGRRISGMIKINSRTGAIVETFGLDSIGICSTRDEATLNSFSTVDFPEDSDEFLYENFGDESRYYGSHEFNSGDNKNGPFITLGKTVYDLTVHSKNNTSWNITYVHWGPNNLHTPLAEQNTHSLDDIYIQPFHDSSLLALDAEAKSVKWVSNLPFVTVNIFDVLLPDHEKSEYIILPHPIDSKKSTVPSRENGATYLDRTKEGSWYALSEEHFPSLVRSAPLAKYISNERWRLPAIFANDDLLEISIAGVHDDSLKRADESLEIDAANIVATYPSATGNTQVPVKYSRYISGGDRSLDVKGLLDGSISYNENELEPNYLARNPTSTFKNSTFSQLIFRALENVFVALVCLAIFYVLNRFGLFNNLIAKTDNFDHHSAVEPLTGEKDSNRISDNETFVDTDAYQANADLTIEAVTSANKIPAVETFEGGFSAKADEMPDTAGLDKTYDTELAEITKKKRKRGTRGGRRNRRKDDEVIVSQIITSSIQEGEEDEAQQDGKACVQTRNTRISNNLVVTDEVLGFGSHGTIVFKGIFENRPVAVKRMLIDFYDVASHEINLLQESDDHSNVVRYFCSQEYNKFLYIALELCSASLEDVVERKKNIYCSVDKQNILYQIANGVYHLHSLKIVHRDIKPQNILVATSKKAIKGPENKDITKTEYRFLISDFGLCKKLENDQSSFKGTTANAAGTSGWRAPELLLDSSPAYRDQSLKHKIRLTRSVDIFSTGCVFFYVLTSGYHPFGDRYIREGNIIKNEYDLSKLDNIRDSYVAKDLISRMIQKNPRARPNIVYVLKHPYFWSIDKKLDFLLKVSDRFEVERREPPSELLLKLESIAPKVLGPGGWFNKFDSEFIDNLGKYRKYDGHKLMDLLRAIRNKYHHYQDLPESLAAQMGPLPDGFYWYFAAKFPQMLMTVYSLMNEILRDDELLAQFFI